MLRYRRSGGRTELSEHQDTGNFTENPNSMVPRAGLGGGGGEKSKKMCFFFAPAKRAGNLCTDFFKKNDLSEREARRLR